jgi:hypothetical protein
MQLALPESPREFRPLIAKSRPLSAETLPKCLDRYQKILMICAQLSGEFVKVIHAGRPQAMSWAVRQVPEAIPNTSSGS